MRFRKPKIFYAALKILKTHYLVMIIIIVVIINKRNDIFTLYRFRNYLYQSWLWAQSRIKVVSVELRQTSLHRLSNLVISVTGRLLTRR